jgi:diaminopropionate ammonia-lyase
MPPVSRAPLRFHQQLPGYRPTRLVSLEPAAYELGLRRLWLKDESYRLGLPAFKVLGVAWAAYRALCDRIGREPAGPLSELRRAFAPAHALTLVAATDGNHGRAVAHVAGWFGLAAHIFVPRQIPPDRLAAIRSEGADVEVVDGTYDDAVEAAADAGGSPAALLLADTAACADEVVPRWIAEGYSTLFWEIEDRLAELEEPTLDAVIVQIGVGSLAAAAAAHFRRDGADSRPLLVGVEPSSAACVFASVQAGRRSSVPGPHTSIMDCLNAGLPSAVAFPAVLAGFDAFAAVEDGGVGDAVARLAAHGVVAGTTGAAGLVGLLAIHDQLELAEDAAVLLLNTEGFADPGGYATALLSSTARAA